MTKPTAEEVRREMEALELRVPADAKQRTDALLRNLLNAPPHPHQAPKKPAKRAPKKPRKK